MKHAIALMLVVMAWPALAQDQTPVNEGDHVWRITTLRAAAGKWRALKSVIENQGTAGTRHPDTGRAIPFRIRHSQGDQWDFMILQPVADLPEYFAPGPTREAEKAFRARISANADFARDWFASGPSPEALKQRFDRAGLFHVELFRARANHHAQLLNQRRRENIYYAETGRAGNAIFTGLFGADWDNMTIGFHNSLEAFAAGSGLPAEAEEAAARAAGFDGTADFAPYLRSLLVSHNDTLAVAMK